jgi:hypothetical protein
MVPNPLNFKWKDVRVKTKLKKNVSLIWMVWHQAIVINVWHAKINKDIAMMCPFCNLEALKSLIHRFWDCHKAKMAWEWAFTILHRLHNPRQNEIRRKAFDIKQCLFTKKLPKNYKCFSHIYTLVRSTIM